MSDLTKAREDLARVIGDGPIRGRWMPAKTAAIEALVRAIIADPIPKQGGLSDDYWSGWHDGQRHVGMTGGATAPSGPQADPLPKDGEAGFYLNAKVHQWLKDAPRQELVDELISLYHQHHHDEARIAELERERDAEQRMRQEGVRMARRAILRAEAAEATAARLRKAAEEAAEILMEVSASSGMGAVEIRKRVLSALTILAPDHPFLTAALQPEPGTGE